LSKINAPAVNKPLTSESAEARGKVRRFPPGQYYVLVNTFAAKAGVEFKLHWTRRGAYRYIVGGKKHTLSELVAMIDRKLIAKGKKSSGLNP
jgi:hypothetical protein